MPADSALQGAAKNPYAIFSAQHIFGKIYRDYLRHILPLVVKILSLHPSSTEIVQILT